MRIGPLYHWSPTSRRDLIIERGLRPGCAPIVATTALDCVCLGFSPATAWAISGAMPWVEHVTSWDLWEVQISAQTPIRIREEFGPNLQEVTTYQPVPAEQLWLVGTRRTEDVDRSPGAGDRPIPST